VKSAIKFGLLAAGLGLAMQASIAQAAPAAHWFDGNSVNYCQAFTPGPANTIRNRVVGSENVGDKTMNVACNFASVQIEGATGNPFELDVYFSNNNASGSVTINCTLLTSYQGSDDSYTSTKSVEVAAGTQEALTWIAADNPEVDAADLGSDLIGVNCSLPKGGVINDTYLGWMQDDAL
jgi:hypothetical protein